MQMITLVIDIALNADDILIEILKMKKQTIKLKQKAKDMLKCAGCGKLIERKNVTWIQYAPHCRECDAKRSENHIKHAEEMKKKQNNLWQEIFSKLKQVHEIEHELEEL